MILWILGVLFFTLGTPVEPNKHFLNDLTCGNRMESGITLV